MAPQGSRCWRASGELVRVRAALALLFLTGTQAAFGQHNLETDTDPGFIQVRLEIYSVRQKLRYERCRTRTYHITHCSQEHDPKNTQRLFCLAPWPTWVSSSRSVSLVRTRLKAETSNKGFKCLLKSGRSNIINCKQLKPNMKKHADLLRSCCIRS